MKIEIITISKNKSSYIDEAEAEYLKRLSAYATIDIIVIKEVPVKGDDEKVKKEEGDKIISKLKEDYLSIALDVTGQQYSSEEFSNMIESQKDYGGNIQFIIGGPLGLSGEVLAHCNRIVSLSKMTFTHQMIRVLLLEQIYRGFEILKGSGYHK